MKTYLTVYFGTALMAILLVPVVSRLAKRYSLVDAPGPRKVHKIPVPRIGGIAFVIPILTVVLPIFFLSNDIGESFRDARIEYIVLLIAATFIFVVGFIDDLFSIRGYIKLSCLIIASLGVCASGATVGSFSLGAWFEVQTGWVAWPLTVLWITVITVCMNLIDGLDGLAGGIAVIVCGSIALLAFMVDQGAMVILMLAMLGGVTGFLFFNFHPARIFMGDGGSLFLGFMIGAGSIVCQTKTSTIVGLALPLLVLGVPIFDTGFTVIRRRILERRSMFAPDRNHLHHRLLDIGLRQPIVVVVIYAITAINASIGLFMLSTEKGKVIGLFISGLLLLFAMFAFLHDNRNCKIVQSLRHNWAMGREARAARRSFENAEMRMRDVSSLSAWWEILCDMGRQMHFQSIGLWSRRNGHYTNKCTWKLKDKKFAAGKTIKLSLPLHKKSKSALEVRARIWVNGYLELCGQQAMLLARLIDECPPPDWDDERKESTMIPKQHVGSNLNKTEEVNHDSSQHTDFEGPGIYPNTI